MKPLPDPDQVRQRLRESLKVALNARDKVAVAALRSALSAIDNAEAVDRSHAPSPGVAARLVMSGSGLGLAKSLDGNCQPKMSSRWFALRFWTAR